MNRKGQVLELGSFFIDVRVVLTILAGEKILNVMRLKNPSFLKWFTLYGE